MVRTERFQTDGFGLLSYISSFLNSLNDVNVAQHVDIDGVQAANHPQYMQTVEKARLLMRTLEAAVQALFDDSTTLFLTIGSHRASSVATERERISQYEYVDAMLTAIRSNLGVVIGVLDALVAVGHDQAEVGQQSYRNSIEWRRSRLHIEEGDIDIVAPSLQPPQEDVVDMELAFSNQGSSRTMHSLDTASATVYSGSTHFADSSLSMSDSGGDPITPTWSQEPSETGTLVADQHSPTAESFIDDVLDDEPGRESHLHHYDILALTPHHSFCRCQRCEVTTASCQAHQAPRHGRSPTLHYEAERRFKAVVFATKLRPVGDSH